MPDDWKEFKHEAVLMDVVKIQPVTTFDGSKVFILKIDVQGCSYEVTGEHGYRISIHFPPCWGTQHN